MHWKESPYRNQKLLDAARGEHCKLNIPFACIGGTDTTVACHSPLKEDRYGSQKSDDTCISDGCRGCHDYLDRRSKMQGEHITEENQRYFFHRGMVKTIKNRIERGIIKT